MRIVFPLAGTRGDIQPAIALGQGLQHAGHQVRLISFEDFRELVSAHGLDFSPIHLDMGALLERFARPQLFDSGAMAARFLPEVIRAFRGMFVQMGDDFWEASQDADAIVGCPATAWLAYAIAEKLGVPYIATSVLPLAPTAAFPSIFWPHVSPSGSGRGVRGRLNLFTYRLFQMFAWGGMRLTVNRFRHDVLGLPPAPLFGKAGQPDFQQVLTLAGFSQQVLARPADWGAHIHVTGYWFVHSPGYEPPPGLVQFLEAGPPPVYVGFGSMPSQHPEQMAALVIRALRLAGLRGILFTGKGILGRSMAQEQVSGDLCTVDAVSHEWLFPRLAAVVHHGGSGTTAAGLRAGRPSLLVPVATDQLLWAQRVADLGVGPTPISRPRLTAERLAQALSMALADSTMHSRAAALGEKIRAEDGVGRAVQLIEGQG